MTIDPNSAIDFMIKNSEAYALAKAQVVYLTEYRKTVKSQGILRSLKTTVVEKEADAYTTAEYTSCVEGLREAVAEAERLRWMLVAAQARVDCWRSMEASNRAVEKATV